MDKGELWSFLRAVLSQGRDIWLDHLRRDYEVYSARLDAAASERVDGLLAKLRPDETSHCIDCIELKNALASAVGIANEARERHARDQDMRVAKILIALSGYLPKYRADTDRIHDVLKRAVDRLSAPIPPEEPSEQQCACGAASADSHTDKCPMRGTPFYLKPQSPEKAMAPHPPIGSGQTGVCPHGVWLERKCDQCSPLNGT